MRFAKAVSLLLLLSALAGCNSGKGGGDGGDGINVDDDEFDDLVVTQDTGVIRGVVVDEAIRPVAGAVIAIQSLAKNTTSAESGAFGFDGLAPGTYFLEVGKAGYQSVQVSADVFAGVAEPDITKVLLVADPTTSPTFVPYHFEGYIACSVRAVIRGQSCDVAPDSNEEILFDIELDAVPTYAQGELVWDSTQAFGDELSLNWRRDDTNADYVDIEGPSPLILTSNETVFAEQEVGAGQPLRTIIFTAHNPATEPPECIPDNPVVAGCLWGVGVQLNQAFNLYIHVFYNMLPPEGWTFGESGDPKRP